MNCVLEEGETAAQLTPRSWDLAVVGKTVDDRGTAATDFVSQCCSKVVTLSYRPSDLTFEYDGNDIEVDDFRSTDLGWNGISVLLEATTLGFVELLYACAKLNDVHSLIDCMYVEPFLYRISGRTPLLHRRDFELSEEVPGYQGIPGFTLLLDQGSKVRPVFFLGTKNGDSTVHSKTFIFLDLTNRS